MNRTNNEFFGSQPNVDITLADINTKLNDIITGIPDIIQKTSMVKIPHKQIKHIVYTVESGFERWTLQNNSIKHIAEVTGVYRLSVFSGAKFRIIITPPSWHHSTDVLWSSIYFIK